MIREAAAIAARALARPDDAAALSVVRVQTTRALHLVFEPPAEAPLAVVQFGPRDHLCRLHQVLTVLHGELPDLVPASLACGAWTDNQYFHVQLGLPGVPWFTLRESVTSLAGWVALRQRALTALQRFHDAVRRRAEWVQTVDPATQLVRQLARVVATAPAWPSAVPARVLTAASGLGALGAFPWPYQHGDFCFNNLLVTGDRLGLIDFEEFGETAMPLHDELSLAFSADEFMSGFPSAPLLTEQIAALAGPTVAAHPELGPVMDGLLFHHLLWRANQCADRPTRAPMRSRLLALLERFATGELAAWLET